MSGSGHCESVHDPWLLARAVCCIFSHLESVSLILVNSLLAKSNEENVACTWFLLCVVGNSEMVEIRTMACFHAASTRGGSPPC